MAIPLGASSKAERKRTSLSRMAIRASSLSRQETMFTAPSAVMNRPWMPAQRHGCACASAWSNTELASRAPMAPWWTST